VVTGQTEPMTDYDPNAVAGSPSEIDELLALLDTRRFFLLKTADGLTDEQATSTPTVSSLSIAGLIKHVANTEANWIRFAQEGASALRHEPDGWENAFRMGPDQTLADLIGQLKQTAAETNRVARTLPLDAAYTLPEAPWFPPNTRWSVRHVLLHLIGEIAQHAGHADIIRESIDGQKTMG
jgi:hypothetical protein